MSTISIFPENHEAGEIIWRAVAGDKESLGKTAGEALDELMTKLDQGELLTPMLVRQMGPDQFFTAEQQQRLSELMSRWRVARDAGQKLPPGEQAELEALVEAQLEGSAQRAEAMLRNRKS